MEDDPFELLLGFNASQRRRMEVGVHVLRFRRRKFRGEYFYSVELSKEGKVETLGLFTDYAPAVRYAGKLVKAIMYE
ncbi:hypothetical protein HS1genome_1165 [Sulfodiicoccus acidiphilus]|uniref:Uncharacterized protein n=1 Tax=Sulfodiicoccus acidiphilus TaxID=1670455 RepID=A0A348B3M4_9CREN|nr:hypothetical protein [Sulfodiicoccus acidiphilus]BBD72776.1 hypothetical protein HS1genome_1165 [Sulfodiicoccus acidiphilus]GGT99715.1 hypothetical protein GCM10007116_16370 [Sulfodiicoccus acidiphilus]